MKQKFSIKIAIPKWKKFQRQSFILLETNTKTKIEIKTKKKQTLRNRVYQPLIIQHTMFPIKQTHTTWHQSMRTNGPQNTHTHTNSNTLQKLLIDTKRHNKAKCKMQQRTKKTTFITI